ncbi:hypothetical protein QJS10_CPA03g01835 [Acorus calamus]|uniref:Uncharacterized protein n=1 Tax=Acorus calamus TaxID=4465 RepID=A0AAV9F8J1_ACOCL|nr:hypothetical protein QJS10_CPA03g01835 [Acorus calamus]
MVSQSMNKTHFTKERTIDERQTDPKITGILLANQTDSVQRYPDDTQITFIRGPHTSTPPGAQHQRRRRHHQNRPLRP